MYIYISIIHFILVFNVKQNFVNMSKFKSECIFERKTAKFRMLLAEYDSTRM